MWNPSSETPLLRRYRDGDAAIPGYAEDYAFLIFGLLELFQADAQAEWLAWAVELQEHQNRLFWDEEGAGWFSTSGRDPSVLVRMKEDYDGAEPTASSVSVWNLLTLTRLVDCAALPVWNDQINRTLRVFSSRLEQMGRGVPMMAAALSMYLAGQQQVVIVRPDGDEAESAESSLEREMGTKYRPFTTTIVVSPATQRELATLMPHIASMKTIDNRPTAYVCANFSCQPPVTTVDDLSRLLTS
jgi:uncharacterized protein YyaL (SSP411 family)